MEMKKVIKITMKGGNVLRRSSLCLMAMLLCVGVLMSGVKVQTVRASIITVPDDYSTIQAAINAASPGDTIYVRNGVYPEHLELNKTVTLMGESNLYTCITSEILSEEVPDGIYITASNCTLENFNITCIDPKANGVVFVDGADTGCSDTLVLNNTIASGYDTTLLTFQGSSFNRAEGNQIIMTSDVTTGIAVVLSSSYNIVDYNNITGGYIGVAIDFADNNTVSNNYITEQVPFDFGLSPNLDGALYLGVTSGDLIRENTFVNNSLSLNFGLEVSNVQFYHNNIINDSQQPILQSDAQISLDNGYPSGGNYWSNYKGTDAYSGVYQNVTGQDGIGDSPYAVNAKNIDLYPLMQPYHHLIGDLNDDGRVGLDDLTAFAWSFESTPGMPNWNSQADFNGNGVVDLADLVTLALHYGQHEP